MLQRILVPLDGSQFAEVAVPAAARLARASGGQLRLIRVHEPVMAPMGGLPAGLPLVDLDTDDRAEELAYLADVSARMQHQGGLRVTTTVRDGFPGPAVEEEVRHWRPDLLVMATHGRGAIGRMFLGSVAVHLLRHADVPILLFHPTDSVDWASAEREIRSILVPLDLSTNSEAILGVVTSLATLNHARVTLATVVTPVVTAPAVGFPYPTQSDLQLEQLSAEQARIHLERVAETLRAKGLSVHTIVLHDVGVAASLLRYVEHSDFDLVALTTHGTTGLAHVLMGSVAERIVSGTKTPVLVQRMV